MFSNSTGYKVSDPHFGIRFCINYFIIGAFVSLPYYIPHIIYLGIMVAKGIVCNPGFCVFAEGRSLYYRGTYQKRPLF